MTPTGISMTARPAPGLPSAPKWVPSEADGGDTAGRAPAAGTQGPESRGGAFRAEAHATDSRAADSQAAGSRSAESRGPRPQGVGAAAAESSDAGAPADSAAPGVQVAGVLGAAHAMGLGAEDTPIVRAGAVAPGGVAAAGGAAVVAGESPERGADGARMGGRKRKSALSAPARVAVMGVAAVVLGTATVGIQAWDRLQWVAERYPAEDVRNVSAGQSVERAGMRWSVQVSRAPTESKPGRVMLQITVRLTPLEEKAIQDYLTPTIELRDNGERSWMTLSAPGETPIRTDLRVGQTARIVAYGVVPQELEKTAKVALVYSDEDGSDVLLFSR